MNITADGGELTGERLKGSLEGAAGDWILTGSDGFARLDVRGTLHTVDDAFIHTRYVGLLELAPGITAVLEGGDSHELRRSVLLHQPSAGDRRRALRLGPTRRRSSVKGA
jgi:hypothetical protein